MLYQDGQERKLVVRLRKKIPQNSFIVKIEDALTGALIFKHENESYDEL